MMDDKMCRKLKRRRGKATMDVSTNKYCVYIKASFCAAVAAETSAWRLNVTCRSTEMHELWAQIKGLQSLVGRRVS